MKTRYKDSLALATAFIVGVVTSYITSSTAWGSGLHIKGIVILIFIYGASSILTSGVRRTALASATILILTLILPLPLPLVLLFIGENLHILFIIILTIILGSYIGSNYVYKLSSKGLALSVIHYFLAGGLILYAAN